MRYPKCKEFFNYAINDLTKNKIGIHLVRGKQLHNGWGGEFDPESKEVRCAIGGPFKKWFPTFLHEYCHFKQYQEQCDIWVKEEEMGSYSTFFEWVEDKQLKVLKKELIHHTRNVKNLEHDCEKRTVKLLIDHNLEINIEEYIQHANAYVCSYDAVLKKRQFVKKFVKPYIKAMPKDKLIRTFQTDQQINLSLKCF